jgi:predicted Ser/Thr protein kinase
MTSSLTCPDDAELLAVVAGEVPSDELRQHLDRCPMCAARRERLRADLAAFREGAPDVPSEPLALGSLSSERVPTNGQTDDSNLVVSPQPVENQTTAPHLAETDLGFACEDGDSEEPAPPAAIGRYLVIGRFRRTGQAEVFRVVHPGLARDLVLKLALNPVEPGVRHEIIEEGKILAELKHPNLVQIYDLDWHDDRPYLVMEYIRGRSLDQIASEGRLKPRQAAALLAKVAAAADYAHRHGIIHRDIKPKNIVVDEAGEPWLIDFGMARLRHAWSEDPGRPGGTFAFMPPEQARVESPEDQQKVGPRSDVFALGAVLYYLLTGKAPFEAETWRESWDRARRCDFDRAALEGPRIPRGLRLICLKGMAADPAERFASAEDLARGLKSFLRWPSLIAATALAVLIPAVAVGAWHVWPRPPARVIQPLPAPTALAGELTVRVWSKGEGGKRGLKIDDPGALPLLAGELVHLEAKLNQPAYPYLLWLDGQGHVSVLYPRQDRKFGGSPETERARDEVHIPKALDDGLRMKGPGGLETALLLVRRTPLPAETDLTASTGSMPPSPLRSELEVATRGGNEGQRIETLGVALHRGIDEESAKIDDPLLQVMERMKMQWQFDMIKAVRFAYRGE